VTFILWCILLVLRVVLAAGFAGACCVPDCLADLITVPHSGDCGRRCLGTVARNFVLAWARIAGVATRAETR
jgi:hypothetical protein